MYKRKLRMKWWYRQLRLVYAQGSQQLAIPHLSLPSISYLRWESLRNAGFQAVVLDKDNTITKPYGKKVESQLLLPLDHCRKVFEGNIALYSNSAGLMAYDHVGEGAKQAWPLCLSVCMHIRVNLVILVWQPFLCHGQVPRQNI